jgi:hypothetical protein
LPVQLPSQPFDPAPAGWVIEVAKAISLDPIGDGCKQKVPR